MLPRARLRIFTMNTMNEVTSASPSENSVSLIGELRATTRKSETKTGALMVRRVISIARHWTDQDGRLIEDYDDFELSSWGGVAERMLEISSGSLVRVRGRVKVERWVDGAETKSAVRIAAEHVQVLCF